MNDKKLAELVEMNEAVTDLRLALTRFQAASDKFFDFLTAPEILAQIPADEPDEGAAGD